MVSLKDVKDHAEQKRSDPEWSGATLEWRRVDNKMRNNLGLSLYAVPQSSVVCVVVYFRRTELLPGVQERSDILIRVGIEHIKDVDLRTKELGYN